MSSFCEAETLFPPYLEMHSYQLKVVRFSEKLMIERNSQFCDALAIKLRCCIDWVVFAFPYFYSLQAFFFLKMQGILL